MQIFWKHIANRLNASVFSKYLVLGLVLLFAKDVVANAEITILAEKLVEKEKKETEKETSEEEDDEQASSSVGKFKKIKKVRRLLAQNISASTYTTTPTFTFVPLVPILSRFVHNTLPTNPYSAKFATPRYIQFHSLVFYE